MIIMKKLFFSVMALTIGAFAFVSCDKDDKKEENRKEEENVKYLTLAEQQDIIGNLSQQLADKIDFTQIQEAIAMLAPLKDLPFDEIAEAAEKDRVMNQIINRFEEMEDIDGNIVVDFSKLTYRFKLNFVPTGDGDVVPQFELITPNHDCFQIDMDYEGHALSVWLKGEGNMTTVKYFDAEESHSISVPKNIFLGLDCDGSNLFGAALEIDTDLKITYHEAASSLGEDEDNSFYSIDCGRLNLAITLNAAQYALDAAVQYMPESGIKVTAGLSDIVSKSEILKVDAGLDGTLKKEMNIEESDLMAWMMNSKTCRKLWADVSLLAGEMTLKMTLDNPIDGIPAQDRMEYMRYLESGEKMPKEVSQRLRDQFMTYFDNGIYFKGYEKAQSKVVFKANQSNSVDVSIVSCDPKSEESMTWMEFLLTDKVNESLTVIIQKVLPFIGMFQSNEK